MNPFTHYQIPFLILLAFAIPTKRASTKEQTMTKQPSYSCRMSPWGGTLPVHVDFEISKTTSPLEYRFTITNVSQQSIKFPLGPGQISISYRNDANLPIPLPIAEIPMDLIKGAKDPNDDLIEFYEIKKNDKPGKRFRQKIISLDPNQSKKILVRMGSKTMTLLNGYYHSKKDGKEKVNLGVWALVSIISSENREMFARFRTDPKIFFPYALPKKKE